MQERKAPSVVVLIVGDSDLYVGEEITAVKGREKTSLRGKKGRRGCAVKGRERWRRGCSAEKVDGGDGAEGERRGDRRE